MCPKRTTTAISAVHESSSAVINIFDLESETLRRSSLRDHMNPENDPIKNVVVSLKVVFG